MNRAEYILPKVSGKVLDVGFYCGTLHKRIEEKIRKEDLFGVDIELKKETDHYKICDVEKKIDFPAGLFDCIVAGEVIEHLHKPAGFLKEANRVLKKGGRLIITTPNRKSMINRLFKSYHAPLHFTLFTIDELKKQTTENGFLIEECRMFPYTPESCDNSRRPELFVFRKISHYVLPHSLRENTVLICKKQ